MTKTKTKKAPESATTTESCGSCRYYRSPQCHRHAPAPISYEILEHALGAERAMTGLALAWPVVSMYDWCGEYRQAGGTR